MEFKSNFLEHLKLLLKGKYIISDEVLVTLSDMISRYRLDSLKTQSIVIDLFTVLDKHSLKFPMSLNYFKSLWEKEVLTADFKTILRDLLDSKLVSVRKMSSKAFTSSNNINKTTLELNNSNPFYLTVFGSTFLNNLFLDLSKILVKDTESLSGIILKESANTVKVCEGVILDDLDSKYKTFLMQLAKKIRKSFNIGIYTESYDYDSFINEIEFNFVLTIEDIKSSSVLDKDLRRIFKKWVKDVNVTNIEVYIDGNSRVFLGLVIDMSVLPTDFTDIIDQIALSVDEVLTSM